MSQRTNLNDVKDILELIKIKIERNEEYFQKQKTGANTNGNSKPIIMQGNLESDNKDLAQR